MVRDEIPEGRPLIALVGEAPGGDEVIAGRPFVGASGRLLNTALRMAGVDRRACLVTNVFHEQAPGNDVQPWVMDPARWGPACARLHELLRKHRPNVIVALGATAARALLGKPGRIAAMRGNVYASPAGKVLVTYHPAAVLRAYHLLPLLVRDLAKARRESATPELHVPQLRVLIEPTVEEVERECARMAEARRLVVVDIETSFGMIDCVGLSDRPDWAMCVPFEADGDSYWEDPEHEFRAWRAIERVLADPHVPIAGQNLLYDMQWLAARGIAVRGYTHDTRLAHAALWPQLPKDLGSMASLHTNLPAFKHLGRGEKRDG